MTLKIIIMNTFLINWFHNLIKYGYICVMGSGVLFVGCSKQLEEKDIVGKYKAYPYNTGYRQFAIYSNGLYMCEYLYNGDWIVRTNSWRLDIEGRLENSDARLELCGFRLQNDGSVGISGVAVLRKWTGGIQILIDGRGTILERYGDCPDIEPKIKNR